MAINTSQLKVRLGEIFADLDEKKSAQDKANEIADALDTWVKTAVVSTQVQTTVSGSCPAGAVAGVGVGTGTGSLS